MICLLLMLCGNSTEIIAPPTLPTRPSDPVMQATLVALPTTSGAHSVMWSEAPNTLADYTLSQSTTLPSTTSCYPVGITLNTPTGIAGCQVWGSGIASHFAPGSGVAMNFCTWVVRNETGCGSVTITSVDTGLSVSVPVVDFCDCYTGTDNQRIVDLQFDVVVALGLDLSQGLYPVIVER